MAYIDWSEEYSVGIERYDRQHKRIFQYINDLHAAMKSGADNTKLESILNGLVEYTISHFTEEIGTLREHGYGELDEHSLEHEKLLSQVTDYVEQFKAGRSISVDLLQFLIEWLKTHIQGVDKRYTQFLIDAGMEPSRSSTASAETALVPTRDSGSQRNSGKEATTNSAFGTRFGIRAKMLAGFGVLTLVLLGMGIISWQSASEINYLTTHNLSNALTGADGSMESRIEAYDAIWGALDASSHFSKSGQKEGRDRIKRAVRKFGESIQLLQNSTLVDSEHILELKTLFKKLVTNGRTMADLSIKQSDQMETTDEALGELTTVAMKGGASADLINTIWQYGMDINDYAAYRLPEVKSNYTRIEGILQTMLTRNSDLNGPFLVLKERAERLVLLADKLQETRNHFDKAGKELDKELELIESGKGAFLGTNAYSKAAFDEIANLTASNQSLMLMLTIAGVMLGLIISLVIASRIVGPVNKAVAAVHNIAHGDGDLTTRVEITSHDEIGELSHGVNLFIERTHGIIRQITSASSELSDNATTMATASKHLVNDADNMQSKSNGIAAAVEESSTTIHSISHSVEGMTSSVKTVAAAMEELSASFNEVNNNCSHASNIAHDADTKAVAASDTINHLSESSKEIHKVLDTIKDIADQTKLLALNATIEAASAGDAGKGFAVVADEVKELAKQTNSATDEIAQQIQTMSASIEGAVESISLIGAVITEMNNITRSINSSVDQQSQTINEISSSFAASSTAAAEIEGHIKEVAGATNEISSNISDMSFSAQSTADNATQSNASAMELSQLSASLEKLVRQFKI